MSAPAISSISAEVRRLGGTISALSEPNKGTEMVILIPTKREAGRGIIAPLAAA